MFSWIPRKAAVNLHHCRLRALGPGRGVSPQGRHANEHPTPWPHPRHGWVATSKLTKTVNSAILGVPVLWGMSLVKLRSGLWCCYFTPWNKIHWKWAEAAKQPISETTSLGHSGGDGCRAVPKVMSSPNSPAPRAVAAEQEPSAPASVGTRGGRYPPGTCVRASQWQLEEERRGIHPPIARWGSWRPEPIGAGVVLNWLRSRKRCECAGVRRVRWWVRRLFPVRGCAGRVLWLRGLWRSLRRPAPLLGRAWVRGVGATLRNGHFSCPEWGARARALPGWWWRTRGVWAPQERWGVIRGPAPRGAAASPHSKDNATAARLLCKKRFVLHSSNSSYWNILNC